MAAKMNILCAALLIQSMLAGAFADRDSDASGKSSGPKSR